MSKALRLHCAPGFVSCVDHLAILGMSALDSPQSVLRALQAARHRANVLQPQSVVTKARTTSMCLS